MPFLHGLVLAYIATFLTLLHSTIASYVSSTQPVVDLGYAQYQGYFNTTTNITSFLGVRYAAPPTGTLRFEAPQSPATTTGLQQATSAPNYCYQAPTGTAPTNPFLSVQSKALRRSIDITNSEDCLFLSVWTPGSDLNTSLPTVVWIHGGGYIAGQGAWYNGADLVNDALDGVVTVVIQYRLGLFGFLPGTNVKENGGLNAGLLDQTFALEWVQKNIHKFGGDPTKVTIWGESAGAGSVLQHVVANGGKTNPPLFRGAITSSTFLPSQYWYNSSIPESLYSEVVTQANCSSASDSLSCLRATSVTTLQTINENINDDGFYGTFVFVPVIDGSFIIESPTATLLDHRHNAEAILSVTNANEGYNFVNQSNTNLTSYITELFPLLSPQQIKEAAYIYSSVPGTTVAEQCTLVMGESIFICPTYTLLEAFGQSGHKGEFAVPPAYHGADLPYYFPSYETLRHTVRRSIYGTEGTLVDVNSTVFTLAFAESFASTVMYLDPNVKFNEANPTPSWDSWSQNHTEMLFNTTEAGQYYLATINTNSAFLQRCAFWESVHQDIGQ